MRGGAPGRDYAGRGIARCEGAPDADTAYMGLTSSCRNTITGTLPRTAGESAGRDPDSGAAPRAPGRTLLPAK